MPGYKKLCSMTPTKMETENNPRARSAHMRCVEKV
jgi:16S rRNA C1402 N4-methylase RsmH